MAEGHNPWEALDPVWILIIDDQDTNGVWDLRLADDAQNRWGAGAPNRLQRFGSVCPTAEQARQAVALAIGENVKIDMILVDNRLQVGANAYETRPEAVNLIAFITDAYRGGNQAMPLCVLATAEPDLLLSHAFVVAGGHQSVSRNVASQQLLASLWRTIEQGARWQYQPSVPTLPLTATEQLILPYLYADLSIPEIDKRVRRDGVIDHDTHSNWVSHQKNGIKNKVDTLIGQINAHGGDQIEPFPSTGGHRRLAQFALERGNIWVANF